MFKLRCIDRARFIGFALLPLALAAVATSVLGQDPPPPKADHHIHLNTPVANEILAQHEPDRARNQVKTLSDLIAFLDSTGVKQAAVLSDAYIIGGFAVKQIPPGSDEYDNVQKENDWLLKQIAPYSGRLVGFCSENPLKSYAVEEIKRCASIGLRGLKLHFTNAAVDLRNPKHIEQLKAVFSAANAVKFPIIVHMRTWNRNYGFEDARKFIAEVLPSAPDVPVQIAHMAGWGGYDSATDEAMKAFIQAFESGTLARKNVYFDLSATVVTFPFSGPPKTAELVSRIRQVGLQHVLYGSDWPGPPSADYAKTLRESLGLQVSELREILDNTAPYLK